MPQNLTQADGSPVALTAALRAIACGDFSIILLEHGDNAPLAEAYNMLAGQNRALVAELARLQHAVVREGQTSERIYLEGAAGGWREAVDSVNGLIQGSMLHGEGITRVVRAVAEGDLSQSVPLELAGQPLKGDLLQTAAAINTKLTMAVNRTPNLMSLPLKVTSAKLSKLGEPTTPEIAGIRTDSTRALTIWPKAAPMMTATARSRTFPFMMNSLKPLSMAIDYPDRWPTGNKKEQSYPTSHLN